MGIHYDYKSTKSAKLMEKQAKREKKLAEKKAKRLTKEGHKKDFIILDAAMNDFMRPALYKATHQIIPVMKNNKKNPKIYEFVGPICESTDKFLTTKKYQKLNEKDLVVICDVGAYGMSLSSNYNLRPKAIELLIKNSKIKIISNRQSLNDLI